MYALHLALVFAFTFSIKRRVYKDSFSLPAYSSKSTFPWVTSVSELANKDRHGFKWGKQITFEQSAI